jgi:hypothetical protein
LWLSGSRIKAAEAIFLFSSAQDRERVCVPTFFDGQGRQVSARRGGKKSGGALKKF